MSQCTYTGFAAVEDEDEEGTEEGEKKEEEGGDLKDELKAE